MTKTLDVHTAEVTTAAVEIKTLTVRGKQVTQAVFRQLEEAELITADGQLAGVPWGRVNYHPDKCADTGKHQHIVWQSGSELRRCAVYPAWFPKKIAPREALTFVKAVLTSEVLGMPTSHFDGLLDGLGYRPSRGTRPSTGTWLESFQHDPSGLVLEVDLDRCQNPIRFASLTRRIATPIYRDDAEEMVQELERLRVVLKEELDSVPPDTAEANLETWAAAELERRRRHVQVREALAELPQLFIAV